MLGLMWFDVTSENNVYYYENIEGGHGGAADSKQVFFFFTRVISPRRSLSLKLSDTRVYEPQIRARLGTTAHFCRGFFLKSGSNVYYYENIEGGHGGAADSKQVLVAGSRTILELTCWVCCTGVPRS